ncbi:MAG: hypothetical protein Tsb002_10080 [Wenzhouxiangellaceae bacterium]
MNVSDILRALVTALLVIGLSACGGDDDAAPAEPVDAVARVDGVAITSAMIDRHLQSRGRDPQLPEQRAAALEELIRVQAVVNKARREKMHLQPEVAAQLALSDQQILFNHFAGEYLAQRPVTAEELRESYNATVRRSGNQQVLLESIRYPDEQAAVAALLALEEGADYAQLAATARAGDLQVETLDWADLSQLPDDYAPVVAEIESGQVVPVPLRTGGGWRVLRVKDRRDYQPPPFDSVRAGLEQDLNRQRLQEWTDRVLSQAEVKRLEAGAE